MIKVIPETRRLYYIIQHFIKLYTCIYVVIKESLNIPNAFLIKSQITENTADKTKQDKEKQSNIKQGKTKNKQIMKKNKQTKQTKTKEKTTENR